MSPDERRAETLQRKIEVLRKLTPAEQRVLKRVLRLEIDHLHQRVRPRVKNGILKILREEIK